MEEEQEGMPLFQEREEPEGQLLQGGTERGPVTHSHLAVTWLHFCKRDVTTVVICTKKGEIRKCLPRKIEKEEGREAEKENKEENKKRIRRE